MKGMLSPPLAMDRLAVHTWHARNPITTLLSTPWARSQTNRIPLCRMSVQFHARDWIIIGFTAAGGKSSFLQSAVVSLRWVWSSACMHVSVCHLYDYCCMHTISAHLMHYIVPCMSHTLWCSMSIVFSVPICMYVYHLCVPHVVVVQ